MKGIILAGGKGTRLYPLTVSISKQILPVYDKPMIYYPLSVLMLANIREILIISTERDLPVFRKLLKDGSDLGLKLEYKVQDKPNGLAEAFIIGEEFIGDDNVVLILGDNIFYGNGFSKVLEDSVDYFENFKGEKSNNAGAMIFGYPVKNPEDYGVVEFDENNKVISLEEKPVDPKSSFAVPGLYFYDNTVIKKAEMLKPSDRNELEITSINEFYLSCDKLKVKTLGRGMSWFDTGTPKGLMEAANFVEAIQNRQGFYIACLEEISYTKGWISKGELSEIIEKLKKCDYKKYLESLKLIDKTNLYDLKEACELAVKTSTAKFDETVELHVKLGVDSRHADQQVRGTVVLPNGTGKNLKVLVFAKGPKAEEAEKVGADFVGAEELIPKIQNDGWFDYDVVVATPDMMGVVGRLGKVLGPKGLMPNPKSGTVTMDVTKAINDIKSGKVEYRLDKNNIVHLGFGKISFGVDKLVENYNVIMEAIIKAKPVAAKGQYIRSVSIAPSMGPGLYINNK